MENLKIMLPGGAERILDRLSEKRFEAYVVGGCVRDSLLGKEPKDWDICTAARPEMVEEIFGDCRIIETGLKHGTVTVVLDDGQYEVTTFRVDGEYEDNRRPARVEFVGDVMEDLARRDFTVNAMAYRPGVGVVDPFGGRTDLRAGAIRCVGDADDRFVEDGLRIMRALRFASVYGFSIADETAAAIHRNAHLLKNIAVERVNVELCKLLCGKGATDILLQFSDVISTIIPEMVPCVGFDQNNRWHRFNVYDHIAHAVGNYGGNDVVTKVALLLHDIGKPECYTVDSEGWGHFYGHGAVSREMSEKVVGNLRFDSATQKDVVELVLYHDAIIEPTAKTVRRWLHKIGTEQLMRLMDVQIADSLAQNLELSTEKIEKCKLVKDMAQKVIAEAQCFSLKQLAVNGRDLIVFGVPEGKMVGHILNELLREVIEDETVNERAVLCERAQQIFNSCLRLDDRVNLAALRSEVARSAGNLRAANYEDRDVCEQAK